MPTHYAFADYPIGRPPFDSARQRCGVRRFGERRAGPPGLSIMSYAEWHPGRDGEPFEIDAATAREALERLRPALDPDAEIIVSYSA